MASLTGQDATSEVDNALVELMPPDILNTRRIVNHVVRSDGKIALAVDSRTVVESTFGFDQNPDSFFRIRETGGAGTTWAVFIRGTSVDATIPDRDVPDYTKIFTVVSGEVGDELKLRDRIIQELNADPAFKNTVFLKARKASDRAIVHISSDAFSTSGEFYERPLAGDFAVTIGGAPGDGVVVIGFDNLISRSKPVTIARDLDSPHALGLFGITGQVFVTAKELSDLFIDEAKNGGSVDMLVNGSGTPVNFIIPASATTDIFVEELIFDSGGNGIKFGQFFSKSGAGGLTNGIEVTIQSDNVQTVFPILKTTEDFKNKWAALSGTGAAFRIDVQSGKDEVLAILSFKNPFVMRVAGSFTTDDFIQVKVQDNISSGLARFNFRAKGFQKEP